MNCGLLPELRNCQIGSRTNSFSACSFGYRCICVVLKVISPWLTVCLFWCVETESKLCSHLLTR